METIFCRSLTLYLTRFRTYRIARPPQYKLILLLQTIIYWTTTDSWQLLAFNQLAFSKLFFSKLESNKLLFSSKQFFSSRLFQLCPLPLLTKIPTPF